MFPHSIQLQSYRQKTDGGLCLHRLGFFPRKYCEKKVILRKRMIVVGQECGKNSKNEVGTERLMS